MPDVEVRLINSRGRYLNRTLRRVLYTVCHPTHKTATASGATVMFKKGKDVMIHRDGTKFHIHVQCMTDYIIFHTINDDDERKDQGWDVMIYRHGMRY